jgi:hypothetical protein
LQVRIEKSGGYNNVVITVNRWEVLSRFAGVVVLVGVLICPSVIQAAGADVAGDFGGASMNGGVGTHPFFGGSGGVRLAHSLLLFGEFGYSHLLSVSGTGSSGGITATSTVGAKMATFGGGISYSFRPSGRLDPYVLSAVGVGHIIGTLSASDSTGFSGSLSTGVGNMAYAGVGGGVRFFLGDKWGVKAEGRFQRYLSSELGNLSAAYYTGGVFYQFGGR